MQPFTKISMVPDSKTEWINCRFLSTYTANVTLVIQFLISDTSHYFLQLERTAPYMVPSITSTFWILNIEVLYIWRCKPFYIRIMIFDEIPQTYHLALIPLTVSVVFRDSSRRVVLSFHFTDLMDENVHRKEASQRNMFPPVRRWFSLTILRIVGSFSKDPSFEKKKTTIKQLELT